MTLKTMWRTADALDYVFVYGFVPREALDDTLKNQAMYIAKKRMSRVAHTMVLEDQGLSEDEQTKATENAANELIRTLPESLWDVDS